MTYQEANDRLTRVQTALQSLKDGSYANTPSINVPQMTSQLQEQEAKLKEQLVILAEAEKTAFVNGQATEYTDEKELEKLKDNQDVKSIKTAAGKKIKEAAGVQYTLDQTKAIAREIGKAVAKGLKSVGDELASMKVTNIEEGSFDIHVQYKKDTRTDDFSFHISGDDLHLTDFSFDKVVGSIGIKPSGEPIVHVDVIANELTKHWKSQMKEGMSDDEFAQAQQNQRLEDHPEKDMIKKIQALITKEKGLKEKVNEAPYQTTYIKVAKSDYKKAMAVLDDNIDPTYAKMDIVDDDGAGNVIIYFNFRSSDDGEPDEDVAAFIYDVAMDLRANDIPVAQASHDIEEATEETPEGGMDQGGDLDVGHQDDEPNMLLKDVYDIAQYAAKLHKRLKKYDDYDGEVDFPQWWQKKIILARDYISAASHYLEGEENQPALDQLALENINEDKADAARWFSNLKFSYQKGLTSPDLKDPADKTEYKRLVKDFFSKLEVDHKVRPIGEAEGQTLSHLKPGDKFEYNGKTYILVKHKEGNIATVILPNGDTSTVSFGGKINTGKKAGIGPDAFGQGKGHHIDEAAYDSATKNELAQYIINLSNELKAAKSRGMDKEVKELQKDIEEVKAALAKKKEVNEVKATCCGKCGRVHVKGTKCKTPYLKGKDHCRYN